MHSLLKQLEQDELLGSERRLIRLDGPCPQAGIAAALRRAFDHPTGRRADDIDEEFDLLLARVH